MRLAIPDGLKRNAVRAALNRLKEKEVHTELTKGARHEEDVLMVTDRNALAREANGILHNLPQVEDEDVRIIVEILTIRLRGLIADEFEHLDVVPGARFGRRWIWWPSRRGREQR